PPALTKTTSSTSTRSTSVSSVLPSSSTIIAVVGAISVKSLIEWRVLANVLSSKNVPNKNKKVTIADSLYSPMMKAPITAMLTSNSMLIVLNRSAETARRTIGTAEIIEAAINETV